MHWNEHTQVWEHLREHTRLSTFGNAIAVIIVSAPAWLLASFVIARIFGMH